MKKQNQLQPSREITPAHLLMISFTAIFGSGWLFAPLYAVQIAGAGSLIAWILGALLSALIGITMAEVMTLFPENGGLSRVASLTHGPLLSDLTTILNLLVFLILPALEVRAILQYLSSHSSQIFSWIFSSGDTLSLLGLGFSVLLLLLITAVNLLGARLMSQITQGVTGFKVITPLILVIALLWSGAQRGALPTARLTSAFPLDWAAIFKAIATSGIIFSFNGFNQATIFAGEAKNPKKAIPFAILGSLFLSALLYVIIQLTLILSIPEEYLRSGWSALSFPGDYGPFAGLASLLGLSWILLLIYSDAVISPLGTAFTYASAAPRLLFSLGKNHSALRSLRELNSHGVSVTAILVTLGFEIAALIFLPNLKAMISILVAAFVLCYTTAPASLLSLRRTDPQMPRPFRILFAPTLCYLSLGFSNLMVFSCGWEAHRNLAITMSLLLGIAFLPGYSHQAPWKKPLKSSAWFLIQMLGIFTLSALHHHHILNFEASALSIFALSAGVLILSQRTDWSRA